VKEFLIKMIDKDRFIEFICEHHTFECEPFFRMSFEAAGMVVIKYYKYRVDITEEEYLFLKLQFDLREKL
jgi:hypothetical protein